MPKMLRLAEPEVLPPITQHRATDFAVNLRSGEAHVMFEKCDDNGAAHGTRAATMRLSPAELEQLSDLVLGAVLKRAQPPTPPTPVDVPAPAEDKPGKPD